MVFDYIVIPALILLFITEIAISSDFAELETKANQGDIEAMYELGETYESGIGTIQNYVEAHKWYNIAASLGYLKASKARDAITEKMIVEQLAEAQKLAMKWKSSMEKESQVKTKTNDKNQLLLQELFKAIHDSDVDKVKALLDSGADPNGEIFTGVPLLIVAVRENQKPVVEALVNAGANINVGLKKGMTLLMVSIKHGYSDIARYLIERGANLAVESDDGFHALSIAKSKGLDDVVKFIIKAGGKGDQGKIEQVIENMFDAVKDGDVETVKKLLALGTDPNKRDSKGRTPLMFAASGGHAEIVEALIKAGADLNMKATDGSTALIAATLQRHNLLVKFLREKGADISLKNNGGETAFNIARQRGDDEMVGLLTINLRSSYKNLPYNQVKAMLQRYNFFDQQRNQTGDFFNDYELMMINGDDVVLDHITGLMWHQSGSKKNMKWGEANAWINGLNRNGYAGYHDWRLPTVEEAASLLESNENDDYLYIDPVFNITQRLIWTGDSFGSRGAWDVNFVAGGVIWRNTNSNHYIRPVRSIK
ncbi:MAG: DUF1566 domain-containing protein [Candidatus Scalindua sp. AMX11]|nr:MAG: DUF1566 domain-containing protein [Candidatus Scalindua sp.]TDE63920.1 MAG: DUF1566 domain-containing protein [Candidatus Scalindua sp. AMX11]GJQ60700.1 MAG: hypothetical protein SCALA701_35010 [Candidatus Scalindua sp.]